MPSQTLKIPKNSPLHKFILDQLGPRITLAEKAQAEQHDAWKKAEERVLAYVPESELDGKRRQRRDDQGTPTYTTIQVPYSYALLMSAHTYWTSVFFARSPVHQYSGRHGESEQQTQAMEALIDYQVGVGSALGPYYLWQYDAGKYGIGVLGTHWEKDEVQFSSINDGQQITISMTRYEGNKVRNVSPWNWLPDPRVPVNQFQKGEFCAELRFISWTDIIRRQLQGYYTNVKEIKTSIGTADPKQTQRSVLKRPDATGMVAEAIGGHPSQVAAYEVYIELIPAEWVAPGSSQRLGTSSFPEKWVFTISQDKSLVLGAQPLGYYHCLFPYDVMETEIEAYGTYNRGIPEIMAPMQNTIDWLINSHFYNVRAALNNIFVADPTKIVMKDLENLEEGGIIRLKPEAYGLDLRTFFHQVPIQDFTQQHMTDLAAIQAIGERVYGVNDQMMGGLTGGGRKTATEVRTSTGFGVNRMKTICEYASATAMSPHSQKLVMNSQQYYDGAKKFRIVGDLAMEAGMKFMQVTPEQIAGFYDFVPVDGVLPIDRMAQANLWKEMLMGMSKVPQVMMQYDLGRIFGWVGHLGGLKNMNQFKIMQPQILMPGQGPGPGMVPVPAGAPPALSAPQDTGISAPPMLPAPGMVQ
jgi:hypothetical protein